MYVKLIAAKTGNAEPMAGDCWGIGYIPDPGSPRGICYWGFMPGLQQYQQLHCTGINEVLCHAFCI